MEKSNYESLEKLLDKAEKQNDFKGTTIVPANLEKVNTTNTLIAAIFKNCKNCNVICSQPNPSKSYGMTSIIIGTEKDNDYLTLSLKGKQKDLFIELIKNVDAIDFEVSENPLDGLHLGIHMDINDVYKK